MKKGGRVKSFSVKPSDLKGREEVEKLEKYHNKTGIDFSILILRAIKLLNKELGL